MIPRRNFLLLAGAALLRGEDRPKVDMLVRSVRPEDLEMPLSGFSDYITPIEHFFVRTHVYVPRVSLSEWRLKVDGNVMTPLTLTMEDLNTIHAYEMSGGTLPERHGFPLRVIATGWAGDSWVKWLTSIRVLDKEHDGFWMKGAYRQPANPVAPGTAVSPEQMQPVTSLRV